MSDIIQLLPDSVANQIAAGEVIQRPASVIKELVENAVDAGATTIEVRVVDAGRTAIQVIDDGKGMSETDARLSFERHATSKIRQADDLFALHTMGFRGEALASIAAVAQVELRTRLKDEALGTHLSIAASRVVGQEPCACPVGSNFLVENLFYNVPARRKFLKSNTTEMNNILAAFERIALVYPQTAFSLFSNDSQVYQLRAGSLRQRVVDIFGKKISQDLLDVSVDTTLCRVLGFVGKPESARKKGASQFFFVNGRYMKHPYFNRAVQHAYDRLLAEGMQVPYFLYFEVPPEDIDVNIHPTKTEIKFENEQAIWQLLTAAVRETIGRFNDIPSIDFDTQGKPDIPVFVEGQPLPDMPKVQYNPLYNPFRETNSQRQDGNGMSGMRREARGERRWETLYEGLEKGASPKFPDFQTPELQNLPLDGDENCLPEQETLNVEDKSPVHYQYKGMYIMTAVKSGLMIIDQHRAHVRILYEHYLANRRLQSKESQQQLFPETLDISPADSVVLEQLLPQMTEIGFVIERSPEGNYVVKAIPTGLDGINVAALIADIISDARERSAENAEPGKKAMEELANAMALSLAQHAAIPYGQVLSNDEMESIVNGLFACSNVNYSPDGKSILTILSQQEIERKMGR